MSRYSRRFHMNADSRLTRDHNLEE
jgi:hypothetical protein